jgi:hypothetical protein
MARQSSLQRGTLYENTIVQVRILERTVHTLTVAAQTLGHNSPLDPAKLEHEAARNHVSKSSEDLRIEILSRCARPAESQCNAFRDRRWYDDSSPRQREKRLQIFDACDFDAKRSYSLEAIHQ